MKRSEINQIIRDAEHFVAAQQFHLPPFARWTPDDWKSKGSEIREITANSLGWDVTDFGLNDFAHKGVLLFTIRNGTLSELARGTGKVYCEKILVCQPHQLVLHHFHKSKTEDIINRGGGQLELTLYNAAADDTLAGTPVVVQVDGLTRTLEAGGVLLLGPGESVTLRPRQYHQVTARGGPVLAGEVSSVNDDHADNAFLEALGRFPVIEEDEAPYRLLVGDYQQDWSEAR